MIYINVDNSTVVLINLINDMYECMYIYMCVCVCVCVRACVSMYVYVYVFMIFRTFFSLRYLDIFFVSLGAELIH